VVAPVAPVAPGSEEGGMWNEVKCIHIHFYLYIYAFSGSAAIRWKKQPPHEKI
jgi:hypothetical protein